MKRYDLIYKIMYSPVIVKRTAGKMQNSPKMVRCDTRGEATKKLNAKLSATVSTCRV